MVFFTSSTKVMVAWIKVKVSQVVIQFTFSPVYLLIKTIYDATASQVQVRIRPLRGKAPASRLHIRPSAGYYTGQHNFDNVLGFISCLQDVLAEFPNHDGIFVFWVSITGQFMVLGINNWSKRYFYSFSVNLLVINHFVWVLYEFTVN